MAHFRNFDVFDPWASIYRVK